MIQYILAANALPDMAAIEQAVTTLDPSALLDRDAGDGSIRIATLATRDELLACLQEAGAPEPKRHLAQLPSDCCGGCGG